MGLSIQDLSTSLPIVPTISVLSDWITRTERTQMTRPRLHTRIDFMHKKPKVTDIALLYLHGFGSSVFETSPLPSMIAKETKSNIVYQRLDRHGISLAPMEYLTDKSWYQSALQGLAIANRIGKEVIVISCSTGSTLSLLLSARDTAAQEMKYQILLSPNCWPHPSNKMRLLTYKFLLPILEGISSSKKLSDGTKSKHILFSSSSPQQAQLTTLRVPFRALYSMMKLISFAWKIRKKHPQKYQIPSLIIAHLHDSVVDYEYTQKFFEHFPAPIVFERIEKRTSHDSHVLAGDLHAPASTQEIMQYILIHMNAFLSKSNTAIYHEEAMKKDSP